MNPRFAIVSAILGFSALCQGLAEPFKAEEFQISVDAPPGWEHDAKDDFGYVIFDPQSKNKVRKIRIHFVDSTAATPKEQAQRSLASINKRKEGKQPPEIIRYEKPFTTRSGIKGYMTANGFKGEEGAPYINHFYFVGRSGRIICVCAYLSGADRATESKVENLILNTLEFLPPKPKS